MTDEDTLFHAEYLCWLATMLVGALLMTLADELRWGPYIAILLIGILCGSAGRHLRTLRKDTYG